MAQELVDALKRRSDTDVRFALIRMITRTMATDPVYAKVIQSVDDMAVVAKPLLGGVNADQINDDSALEARALRCLALDIARVPSRSRELRDALERLGGTMVETPTESVLLASVLLVGWDLLRAGYQDGDRRSGVWVTVVDTAAVRRRFLVLHAILKS